MSESPPPTDATARETVIALFRTADAVRRVFVEALVPYGLTLPQYNVLRILRGAEPEGLATLAIGERTIERAPALTRLVDRLVAKGLVTRMRGADDRRCVRCRATPAGLALLARLDGPIDRADEAALGSLPPAERATVVAFLAAIRGDEV